MWKNIQIIFVVLLGAFCLTTFSKCKNVGCAIFQDSSTCTDQTQVPFPIDPTDPSNSTTNNVTPPSIWAKSKENPVIKPSSPFRTGDPANPSGERFPDQEAIGGPSVIYNVACESTPDSVCRPYQMWYSGADGTSNDGSDGINDDGNSAVGHEHSLPNSVTDGIHKTILYADSLDGKTWVKYNASFTVSTSNPEPVSGIITPKDGTLYEGGAFNPTVIYESDTGIYKMWFTGLYFAAVSKVPGHEDPFQKTTRCDVNYTYAEMATGSNVSPALLANPNKRSKVDPGPPCINSADPEVKPDNYCLYTGSGTNVLETTFEICNIPQFQACAVQRRFHILFTTSTDGKSWTDPVPVMDATDNENGPLMPSYQTTIQVINKWNSFGILNPSVIRDYQETDPNKKYKMWFAGINVPIHAYDVSMQGGLNQCYNSKYFGNKFAPVLAPFGFNVDFTSIGYATSPDGSLWTCQNNCAPVLSGSGEETDGDTRFMAVQNFGLQRFLASTDVNVIKVANGAYWAFYDSASVTNPTVPNIYLARSADGITWRSQLFFNTVLDRERVVSSGVFFTWEGGGIRSPTAVLGNGKVRLWYQGVMYFDGFGRGSPSLIEYDLSAIGRVEANVEDIRTQFSDKQLKMDYEWEGGWLPCTGQTTDDCSQPLP